MSRKGGPVSFASKSMFDVLGDDTDDHEEEEEEEGLEDVQPVSSTQNKSEETRMDSTEQNSSTPIDTSTLSKSARKRLARQSAKTSSTTTTSTSTTTTNSTNGEKETLSQISESIPNTKEVKDKVNGAMEIAKETVTPAVPQKLNEMVNAMDKATKPDLEPTTSKSTTISNGDSSTSSNSIKTTNDEIPSTPKPKTKPQTSVSVPQSNFSPSLPSDIPQSTASQLPSNRKRKAPQDFSPSGPGTASSPTSPSKLGVKFEDGISPGQGKEGEKTIPDAALKKKQDVVERTIWTFIMIFGFIALLCLGHPYMILLVMLCQALVYKEVTALFDLRDHGANQADVDSEDKDTWSKTLNWYFFVVTNYFLYGESIIYYFKHIVFVDAFFIPFARNHRFLSFMLYVVGFVGFVANLKRQHLRQQFALFCWVHITLFLIVVSSHFIVNNILEGLIWFFVPASLVICNDIFAYICGKLFGRTPLIKLSPKKTVEGFVGAFLCTLIFGLAITCKPNPVFVWRSLELTGPVRQISQAILGRAPPAIPYAPFQIHCLVMATFASLVAPFGGFFASGFKRAFNVKDFGHSIPGHGGMTDRMDCQFMMGMFAYVYYSSLIRVQQASIGAIMQTVVTSLTQEEQLELFNDLRRFLIGQGTRIK